MSFSTLFRVVHKLDKKYRFRNKIVVDQLKKAEGALKLRHLSKIGWVARAESAHAVKLIYKKNIELLDAFEILRDLTNQQNERHETYESRILVANMEEIME